jgi:hypothetical protein
MKAGSVSKFLHRNGWRLFACGLVAFLVSSVMPVLMGIELALGWDRWSPTLGPAFFLGGLFQLFGLGLMAVGCWNWTRLDRHPDFQALARYGPPREVIAAIDAELAEPGQVRRLGKGAGSLQWGANADLVFNEVYLTRSWLISLAGTDWTRLKVFRLDSLVVACRREGHAVLVDRHGVRARVPGTDAGLTRLLAEILVRVPWALNRFDEEAERAWQDNRDQVIAAVDRKRQEIRKSSPPPSPM